MAKRNRRFNDSKAPTERKIKTKAWKKYTDSLRVLSDKASDDLRDYIMAGHSEDEILDVAYGLVTRYGEASSELTCQMYEALAEYSGAAVAAAEAAATATYGETARAIRGEMKRTNDAKTISSAAGRLVKLASVDTMVKNALRDGAQWAWIPSGDTCAYCMMLASRGWQRASDEIIANGHATHIHNNCDCTFAVRFSDDVDVEGYNPEEMYDEYINAGDTRWERVNALRRKHYAANKDAINAQKRAAYARRKSIEKSTKNDIISSKGIASPIESRKHPTGDPAGIAISGYNISSRQQKVLDKLPGYDSKYIFKKRDVSMRDLAALTASEGVEFAMFTKGGERLIIRGDAWSVNILPEDAKALARQGYRWSGHTHPGESFFINSPSPGDRNVLKEMNQRYSVIYSSTGRKYVFAVEEIDDIGQK